MSKNLSETGDATALDRHAGSGRFVTCGCGQGLRIVHHWNGLAWYPQFTLADNVDHYVSHCPSCGEWLHLDAFRPNDQAEEGAR